MARDGINGSSNKERRIYQWLADVQQMPSGDNRPRLNPSAKFYVAQLECGSKGCTLILNETAERTRYRECGKTVVEFENERFHLRKASEMAAFLQKFLNRGVGIYVGGRQVERPTDIETADFIYLISQQQYKTLEQLHPAR